MPKKTRQAKILAQLRRLQDQTKPVQNDTSDEKVSAVKVSSSILKSLETPQNTSPKVFSKTETEDYRYVTKDLRKTLIFASGAIIFELVLSVVKSYWH